MKNEELPEVEAVSQRCGSPETLQRRCRDNGCVKVCNVGSVWYGGVSTAGGRKMMVVSFKVSSGVFVEA